MFIVAIIGNLLPLALLGLIIWTIVSWRRSRRVAAPEDAGIGAVRRLFMYGLLFVAAMVATTGLSMLGGEAIDAIRGASDRSGDDSRLALALALSVVGVPTWGALWYVVGRVTRADPAESRAELRRSYFVATRMVALTVALTAAVIAVPDALGGGLVSSGAWGTLLAWTLLWAVHESVALREAVRTAALDELERLYRYGASTLALGFLAIGGVFAVGELLQSAYQEWFLTGVRGFDGWRWTDASRSGSVAAVAGGGVWLYHWRRVQADRQSLLWLITVFLLVMPAAIAATLIALGRGAYVSLEWLLDGADRSAAAGELEPLPMLIATAAAGVVVWAYHRFALVRAPALLSEPERVYRYLVAAAGLVTLAGGVAALLTLPLEALANAGDGRGSDLIAPDRAALVLSLIGVGGATWLRYWSGVRAAVAADPVVEREAVSRRVYLFGTFGVAAAVMITTMSIALYQVFEAGLESSMSGDTLRDVRWPLALFASATIAAVYHWFVLASDRRALPKREPTERRAGPQSILVVPGADRPRLMAELRASFDSQVQETEPVTGLPPDADIDELLDLLGSEARGRRVVVCSHGRELGVVAY